VNDANRVPVVDSQCTPEFARPIIEVKWENYPEVKVGNTDESDAGLTAAEDAKSVSLIEDSCITSSDALYRTDEHRSTTDVTGAAADVKEENCRDVKMETVNETGVECPDMSMKVRVYALCFEVVCVIWC